MDVTIVIKRRRFLRETTTVEETSFTMEKDAVYEDYVPIAEKEGKYIAEVTVEDWGTATEEFDYDGPVTSPVLIISDSISIDMAPDA